MLRPIRDDLDLHAASSTISGYPAWTIHDPVRNKFFQIEWRVFEVLSRWEKGTAERVAKAVNLETTLNISAEFVKQIEVFLFSHQLCRVENLNSTNFVGQARNMGVVAWAKWLLHHYLFFRVPLIKPDKFLAAALPYISFLYSRYMVWALFFSLVLGLFLVISSTNFFAFGETFVSSVYSLIPASLAMSANDTSFSSNSFGSEVAASIRDSRSCLGVILLIAFKRATKSAKLSL